MYLTQIASSFSFSCYCCCCYPSYHATWWWVLQVRPGGRSRRRIHVEMSQPSCDKHRHIMIYNHKDVELYILKSAYGCFWFKWVWGLAQILTEFLYECWYWICFDRVKPDPSRLTRFSMEVNGPNVKVQNAYYSHSSLKIFFTWKDLYRHRNWCSSKIFSVS